MSSKEIDGSGISTLMAKVPACSCSYIWRDNQDNDPR